MVKQRTRVARKRGPYRGEAHHNAKYTDNEVELVRQLHEGGMGYKLIKKKMEMPMRTIRSIVKFQRR
jgi:hypothetical protein